MRAWCNKQKQSAPSRTLKFPTPSHLSAMAYRRAAESASAHADEYTTLLKAALYSSRRPVNARAFKDAYSRTRREAASLAAAIARDEARWIAEGRDVETMYEDRYLAPARAGDGPTRWGTVLKSDH
jgi:hypothetical protein